MSSLAMTAGLQMLASLLSVGFMGALLVVVIDYWQRFPHDKLAFKSLVVGTTLIALADTTISTSNTYIILVTYFGEPKHIVSAHWQVAALFPSIGVSCTILQTFLVYRIYVVSAKRSKVIPIVTMALTLTGAGMSLYIACWLPGQREWSDLQKRDYIVWSWYACHAVSDLLTTGSLLYFIVWKPYRAGGGMSRSVTLQRVVMRAVESNVLSLVWQTLVMCFFAKGATLGFMYAIPAYTLVKIYAYSLVSALNTRPSAVADEGGGTFSRGGPMSSFAGGTGSAHGHAHATSYKRPPAALGSFGGRMGMSRPGNRTPVEEVHVTVVHDVEVDEESMVGSGQSYEMNALEESVERAGEQPAPVRVNFGQAAQGKTKEERIRDLGLEQEKW